MGNMVQIYDYGTVTQSLAVSLDPVGIEPSWEWEASDEKSVFLKLSRLFTVHDRSRVVFKMAARQRMYELRIYNTNLGLDTLEMGSATSAYADVLDTGELPLRPDFGTVHSFVGNNYAIVTKYGNMHTNVDIIQHRIHECTHNVSQPFTKYPCIPRNLFMCRTLPQMDEGSGRIILGDLRNPYYTVIDTAIKL